MTNPPTRLLLSSFAVLTLSTAYAQTNPDAGSLLNESNRALQGRQLPSGMPSAAAASAPPTARSGLTVQVKEFRFQGATLVTPEELKRALQPFTGKSLNFEGLRQAADAVANVYRARGFLARTYFPEQDLSVGVVTIAVVEGRLGGVRVDRVDAGKNISDQRAASYMLARQKVGEPVRPEDLQRAISLLNDLPGVSASSLLEPGQKAGESQVLVALSDTPFVSGSAQLDNTGNKATGEIRLTAGLNLNSPLGIGDQIQISASHSEGSLFGRLAYSLPVGTDGLRLTAALTKLNYDYLVNSNPFAGEAATTGLRASYPLIRSSQANLNLSLAYDRKAFDNQIGGIEVNNKKINVGSLTVQGDRVDGFAGGGITQASVSYATGKLDLSRSATDLNADQTSGANRQGGFRKINMAISRLQRITNVDTLLLSANWQTASRNLDSAEKLVVSGPYAVRSFSASEASADKGLVASVEWQRQFSQGLQVIAFVDQANFRRDYKPFSASPAPNSYELTDAGLGLNWTPAATWSLRSTVAWRLGGNPGRVAATGKDADGTKLDPRLFLTLGKNF